MRISDWSSDVCSSDLPELKENNMRPNDPMSIDHEAPGTACIAFATSEHNGSARWTELSVYRLPDGKFLSQVPGKSSIPAERPKTQRRASTSWERGVKIFTDSATRVVRAVTTREGADQPELPAA